MATNDLSNNPQKRSGPESSDHTLSVGGPGGAATGQMGPYRLLRALGEGGMGEVWLAEQRTPMHRMVALKVIKAGMDTKAVVARFESERQALALMDHPNIAQVYDAGSTAEGRPYFVMEYVPGLPITEYCDKHCLTVKERVELFTQVCAGVQHAHQKAIIHRDLKPSNVLVVEQDGKPVPKIIDFGLAKAMGQRLTDRTVFTELGVLVGTPEYMSPEQADLREQNIDTRTDVYSLGMILYELLVGALPFDASTLRAAGVEAILRVIREEAPPKPSTKLRSMGEGSAASAEKRREEPRLLARRLQGELDWITLKALEKDRTRRYGTPSELAADISRYLDNKPVLARPASATYRFRKYASRHKGLVAATAAVFVVLAAGIVVSTREALIARRADQTAQAVNDFLQNDLLAQASTANQSRPDPDLKVRTVLDRAAASISGKFDHQPEVEAAIRDTIGQTYTNLGLFPEGESQLQRARDLYAQTLGMKNSKTLTAMSHLGRIFFSEGKFPESEAVFLEVSEAQRRVFGPEDPSTLYSLNGLASAYYAEGKYPQAESLHKQILDLRLRLIGPDHPETLKSMNNLVLVYKVEGKFAQAEELDNKLLGVRRRVSGPEHPYTLTAMNLLVILFEAEGKFAQAEETVKQLIDVRRRLLGPDHPDTLDSMGNLALIYWDQGKYAQAEALDNQILEAKRRVLGENHSDTLMTMNNLAVVYASQHKYAQAESLDAQILDIRRRVLGRDHPDVAMSLNNLAEVYSSEGKYAQAESLDVDALELRRRAFGPEHGDTLMSMSNLGTDYALQAEYTQAEEMLAKTLDISNRTLGREHPQTLSTMEALADTYQREGKYDMAEAYASQAFAGRRRTLGAEHPDTLASESELALARQSLGKYSESEPLAREISELDRKTQPNDWLQFLATSLLGASLAGQKKYTEAEPLLLAGYQGMMAREDQIELPERYHLPIARQWLVHLYLDWDKPEKAAEWRRKNPLSSSAGAIR